MPLSLHVSPEYIFIYEAVGNILQQARAINDMYRRVTDRLQKASVILENGDMCLDMFERSVTF